MEEPDRLQSILVAKSRTRLSDFPFTLHFHALEKDMATHSSVLAWRIPGTEEPGGLPSMGSCRVGHDWGDLAAAAAAAITIMLHIPIADTAKAYFLLMQSPPWAFLVGYSSAPAVLLCGVI